VQTVELVELDLFESKNRDSTILSRCVESCQDVLND